MLPLQVVSERTEQFWEGGGGMERANSSGPRDGFLSMHQSLGFFGRDSEHPGAVHVTRWWEEAAPSQGTPWAQVSR